MVAWKKDNIKVTGKNFFLILKLTPKQIKIFPSQLENIRTTSTSTLGQQRNLIAAFLKWGGISLVACNSSLTYTQPKDTEGQDTQKPHSHRAARE